MTDADKEQSSLTLAQIKRAITELPKKRRNRLAAWFEEYTRETGWLEFTSDQEAAAPKAPDPAIDEDRLVAKDQFSYTPTEVRAYVERRLGDVFVERDLVPNRPFYKKVAQRILVGPCPLHFDCFGTVTIFVHNSGYFETDCVVYIQEQGLHGGSLAGLEEALAGGSFLEARGRVRAVLTSNLVEAPFDEL